MKNNDKPESKKCLCPYCDEEITALPYCQPCGLTLNYCPECKIAAPREATVCPQCGGKLKQKC
ncbi:hypothetical protein ACFLUE_00805 [Chloroflexota bacterium]